MAKRIPAGEMRHVVSLETWANSTAVDTYGQVTTASSTNWSATIYTMRAKIEQLSGDEATVARQVYPKATHRVTVDYRSTMDTTGITRGRIVFGSRHLYIGSVVNPDLENFQLQLLCGEER